MMRVIFFSILLTAWIQAETLNQLIDKSLRHHRSHEAIQLRLSAGDDYIAKSRKLDNPKLSFTINDIQFRDISNRSLEPMQWQGVKVKQTFPWFGKLDARAAHESAKKNVFFHTLEAAQVKLAEEIRETVYTIREIDARIAILRKYKSVTRENIDLNTAYTATESNRHSGIISAELTLSSIKIRIEKLKAIRSAQKARLEYLVQDKIKSVKAGITIKAPKSLNYYLYKTEHNRDYHIRQARTRVAQTNNSIKELDKYADPYIELGYFDRREDPNFGSVTIGLSVPIYGSEALSAEAARKEALSARSEAIDYRYRLESEIKGVYARLTEAWRIYRIIRDDSLPQVAHLFELNSASVQSGGDLFAYIDILRQKLTLDEQLVAAKADYLRTQSKLKALTGEIK
jgi:outer membrane protein TolC